MKNMSINTEYKMSKQLSIRYRESAGTRLLAWPDEEVCQARATSMHHRLYVRIRYWPAHVIGLACFHNFQCLQEHIKLKIFLHALLQHSGPVWIGGDPKEFQRNGFLRKGFKGCCLNTGKTRPVPEEKVPMLYKS